MFHQAQSKVNTGIFYPVRVGLLRCSACTILPPLLGCMSRRTARPALQAATYLIMLIKAAESYSIGSLRFCRWKTAAGDFFNLLSLPSELVILILQCAGLHGATVSACRLVSHRLRSLIDTSVTTLKLKAWPADLAVRFPRLESLCISKCKADNSVTGAAVSFQLAQLILLTDLDVSNLRKRSMKALLPDILVGMAALRRVKVLDLSRNALDSIPDLMFSMESLEELNLSDNALEALPAAVGNLRSLQDLNLSNNKLTALPAGIAGCTALTCLTLTENQLQELPAELCSLSRLHKLEASWNKLETLPDEFGALRALHDCDVSDNDIVVLPASVGQLAAVAKLKLSGNWQLCEVPQALVSLTQVRCGAISGTHVRRVCCW
jgi:hypothetical protein